MKKNIYSLVILISMIWSIPSFGQIDNYRTQSLTDIEITFPLLDSDEEDKDQKKKKDNGLDWRIVGLKIGGGPSTVTDFKLFSKHKGGFYVGLSKEWLVHKNIGLSTELNYWLLGFRNDTSLVKTSFNYISVPVMLNINIKRFYFAAGMYGSINLRSSERTNDAVQFYGFQNNRYQAFDWGAVFNAGFKWMFLGFDVRYVMGLQDVVKDMPGNQFNSVLFFGVSFHFLKPH